jgi:hypothetical protein
MAGDPPPFDPGAGGGLPIRVTREELTDGN